ncbi:MAG: hypothetical protein WB699_13285 [Bacteroidota bacterium]
MACVNPDGTLTASASAMLRAMKSNATPGQIAETTTLPLFRVRSALREMVESGLAKEKDGEYQLTELGAAKVQ